MTSWFPRCAARFRRASRPMYNSGIINNPWKMTMIPVLGWPAKILTRTVTGISWTPTCGGDKDAQRPFVIFTEPMLKGVVVVVVEQGWWCWGRHTQNASLGSQKIHGERKRDNFFFSFHKNEIASSPSYYGPLAGRNSRNELLPRQLACVPVAAIMVEEGTRSHLFPSYFGNPVLLQ